MVHDYADVDTYDTLPKLLRHNASRFPASIAVRSKDLGIWQEYSWADCLDEVSAIAAGLSVLGVMRGDVVGIIGENRPEWLWSEIAAHAVGAMSLGIYYDSLNAEVSYLVEHANASVLIAEDEEQADKLLQIAQTVGCIQYIVYSDPRGMRKYTDKRLLSLETLKGMGRKALKRDPDLFNRMVDTTRGADTSVLCPTSGTTSRPKLAMLQSGPFLKHCRSYLQVDPREPDSNYVSVLPLPWIMEQVYCVAQHLIARVIVNFVEEADTMFADLREIGPSYLLLAPRVWESIAADVRARMMDASWLKRRMFAVGFGLGKRALERGQYSKLAGAILFRALRDRLGLSNVKSAITGGAALGPDTFRLFQAMGLPMRQIYGQTELAGAYTTHDPQQVAFDTVGVPFPGTELRIDNPDENGVGEIVARTPGMFTGYYRDENSTGSAMRDGWFHTGDAGYISGTNGHLVVIDRISELATTNSGVRFSPQFIENKLKFSPFVGEAVVLGNGRDFLSAIICIRFSIMSKWAEQRRIAFTNYTDLASRPEVQALIRDEIATANKDLPSSQQIKRFVLLYKELDADDDELTRTRKIRRSIVNEKYKDIVEAIYNGSDIVHVDTQIVFQDGSKSRIKTNLNIVSLSASASNTRKQAA